MPKKTKSKAAKKPIWNNVKLDSCHIHYKCGCTRPMNIKVDHNTEIVTLRIKSKCRNHPSKKALEAVIGPNSIDNPNCQHPGCNCNEVTMQLGQFIYMLQHTINPGNDEDDDDEHDEDNNEDNDDEDNENNEDDNKNDHNNDDDDDDDNSNDDSDDT